MANEYDLESKHKTQNMYDDLKTKEESVRNRSLKPGELLGIHCTFRLDTYIGHNRLGDVWLATEMKGGTEIRQVICKIVSRDAHDEREQMAKLEQIFDMAKSQIHEDSWPYYGMYKDRDFGWFFVMGFASSGNLIEWFRLFEHYENEVVRNPDSSFISSFVRKGIGDQSLTEYKPTKNWFSIQIFEKAYFETLADWQHRLHEYGWIAIGYANFQLDCVLPDEGVYPVHLHIEKDYQDRIEALPSMVTVYLTKGEATKLSEQGTQVPLTGNIVIHNNQWIVSQIMIELSERRVDFLPEWKSQQKNAGERKILTIENIDFPFRWCPPGTFLMGSPISEFNNTGITWKKYDEHQHQVSLTRGFWMLETPVTQLMWKSIMGSNPSRFKGTNRPVESVSWNDCRTFVKKLSQNQKGIRFNLPTESQWEYACRAGTTTPFNFGEILNGDKANCNGTKPCGTSVPGPFIQSTGTVGNYLPNAWGLFDMHGNVWEWCNNWKGEYPQGPITDPQGPKYGSLIVVRGGCWFSSASLCRSAMRISNTANYRSNFIGIRIIADKLE